MGVTDGGIMRVVRVMRAMCVTCVMCVRNAMRRGAMHVQRARNAMQRNANVQGWRAKTQNARQRDVVYGCVLHCGAMQYNVMQL
eukprot:10322852-Lingulodinium_polyedra.AAC.1